MYIYKTNNFLLAAYNGHFFLHFLSKSEANYVKSLNLCAKAHLLNLILSSSRICFEQKKNPPFHINDGTLLLDGPWQKSMLPHFFSSQKKEERNERKNKEWEGKKNEVQEKERTRETSSVFRSRRMITSYFSYETVGLFDKKLKKALSRVRRDISFLSVRWTNFKG